MSMAPNERAIRKWIEKNRPDITPESVNEFIANQGIFGLMAMAFEAGRMFQRANPSAGDMLDFFENYNE